MTDASGLVFGPVPSRRLGRSLGINNLAGKTCSYGCVYCQAGRTSRLRVERRVFHAPALIDRAVTRCVERARNAGERIDYQTFVPSGEPTLDAGLGQEIRRLELNGIPVAVVTNGSLLWRADVREDLADANWVSVKVDTVREATWKRLNRPHGQLAFEQVLAGTQESARDFCGTLATETMLVAGLNESEEEITGVARHIATLRPAVAYISVPLRAPAESWVRAARQRRAAHRLPGDATVRPSRARAGA